MLLVIQLREGMLRDWRKNETAHQKNLMGIVLNE